MTRITRLLQRETDAVDPSFFKPLQIRIEPGSRVLKIRQKGKRDWRSVTLQDIWRMAVRS